jgi:hypothetical protein
MPRLPISLVQRMLQEIINSNRRYRSKPDQIKKASKLRKKVGLFLALIDFFCSAKRS